MDSVYSVLDFVGNNMSIFVTIIATTVGVLGVEKYIVNDKYLKYLFRTKEYAKLVAAIADKSAELVEKVIDELDEE